MSVGETIAECAEAMRKVLHLARTNPELINLPDQSLKIIINASLVGAFLVFANRSLMYPQTIGDLSKFGLSLVIAASSLIFVFLVSALLSLVRTDEKADQIADRWSMLFVFVWFVTLLIFLIDQLLHKPAGDLLSYLGAGVFLGLDRGSLVQFTAYATVAYLILLARTVLLERSVFSFVSSGIGFFVVVPVCVVMLYAFIHIASS